MAQDEVTPIDEPVEDFDIGDLFLTRTDERGVIQAGNDTFRRLSGYDWGTLIGAPHKLVRHPDMPKAAFKLFWEFLQAGHPFGAYVKNMAKDGRYYWVFAAAVPYEEGYISVRLKPTSTLFDQVQALYADLLKAEKNGATPDDGAKEIERAVREMGFRNYQAFMGYALGVELASRCEVLGTVVDPDVAAFEDVARLLADLSEEVHGAQRLYKTIGNSPANLNILGSRLTTGREPMQVVAQNYGALSDELMAVISDLAAALEKLLDKAYYGRMGHCASLLYTESISLFETDEPNRGTEGHAREVARLKGVLNGFIRTAGDGCDQIRQEVDRFSTLTSRLKKMLSGLALTRVICRIESASVAEDTSSIDEIATRLMTFQDELGVSLEKMASMCSSMSGKIPKRRPIIPLDTKLPEAIHS